MAASPSVQPKSTAITILVLFAAASILSTAAEQRNQISRCVNLLFGGPAILPMSHPARLPSSDWSRIACSGLLRSIGMGFKVTGKLPAEYVNALRQVPRFRNNPEGLKKFILGLSSPATFDPSKINQLLPPN